MAQPSTRLLARFPRRALVSFAVLASLLTSRAQVTEAGPPADDSMRAQIRVATFYAEPFQGRRMANGQRYDMNNPTTAASNIWPLGTRLRVRRIPGGPGDASLSLADRRQFMGRWIEVI